MENWFKGNIHCHITNSDRRATPADLARFYKEAGFDFISITDHNRITYQKETGFSVQEIHVIQGSEFTSTVKLTKAEGPYSDPCQWDWTFTGVSIQKKSYDNSGRILAIC